VEGSTDRLTDPDDVLRSVFGYAEFRPGQRKVIDAVLAGRDCIGLMPTGAGKSLTFQVPAKILPGPVLVISPLISLMKDQVDALVRTGFRAALLNSTLDAAGRRATLEALRRGEIELLYVAPESLSDWLRDELARAGIALVVVDEAHCISQWGHDFRPAYRRLQGLKALFGDVPILALTATATRQVVGDILRQLGMRKPDGFKGSFFRPNLIITAHKKGAGRNTRRDVLGVIRAHRGERGIVYCLSRRTVDETTLWLRQQGVVALPYHAGMSDGDRAASQNAFARDECDVIVATVAFGMGIDKSNVRFVVHRDMPKSIEGWYQEIGRAGRDGLESQCVVLYSWADVLGYDRFLQDQTDPELAASVKAKTRALFELLDGPRCRHQALTAYFDERIARCGTCCDRCCGVTVDAIVQRAGPVKRRIPGEHAVEIANPDVFDRLRALRKRLADADGVPAYIVFSDAVLRQMAERLPRDEQELLAISGVGPAKLERWGAEFLRELNGGAAR